MNWDRFDAYLRWARLLLWVCLISGAGIAVSQPLGWAWFSSYFLFLGVSAGILLLGLAMAIALESVDVPNRHL